MDRNEVVVSLDEDARAEQYLQEALQHFVDCAHGDAPNDFGVDAVAWAERMLKDA